MANGRYKPKVPEKLVQWPVRLPPPLIARLKLYAATAKKPARAVAEELLDHGLKVRGW